MVHAGRCLHCSRLNFSQHWTYLHDTCLQHIHIILSKMWGCWKLCEWEMKTVSSSASVKKLFCWVLNVCLSGGTENVCFVCEGRYQSYFFPFSCMFILFSLPFYVMEVYVCCRPASYTSPHAYACSCRLLCGRVKWFFQACRSVKIFVEAKLWERNRFSTQVFCIVQARQWGG